jgi:hypothetical protein
MCNSETEEGFEGAFVVELVETDGLTEKAEETAAAA